MTQDDKASDSTRHFRFSRHALEELERRGIPRELVESVLRHPQQVVEETEGLKAYQSKVDFVKGEMYLLRIIVNEKSMPAMVVTVYRTSKMAKYWRES